MWPSRSNDARYLLQLGLEQLRNTQRVGLLALMHVARVDPAKVDSRVHRLSDRPAHERPGPARGRHRGG